MDYPTWFDVIAIGSVVVVAFMLFLALFEPGLAYKVERTQSCDLDSPDFLRMIEALTDAQVRGGGSVEVLTNGEVYYEAELEAISRAQRSVNLEAYIFQKGEVADRFVKALAERARAGVKVKLVLDAAGSFASWDSYFRELTHAGGRVVWYHPLRWHNWPRYNNRTHRELIVIDGRVGFVGGSGVADHWLIPRGPRARWRDTMFRVEGDLVLSLQATFAENWLESSGEILAGEEYFPDLESKGGLSAFVVNSSPTSGGSTRARILFQMLLASARESILITTPYFLPDRSARREMVRAVKERGVRLEIITPGVHSDHMLTRSSSRRLFGDLLQAGARIHEYQPGMIHAKTMAVDGAWSVVGTTNFDNRSFGLNDEVNLAAFDRELAARVAADFARDRAESREITYDEWRSRPIWERAYEQFGRILERQQ
ncbi:MAG TPA: phospholipase D-like domain-containing protein [Pyrinomonadaceae bacterium]|nr:phospholipase D-like domain-containing protein [Pyrinomonadaceae bacterium]